MKEKKVDITVFELQRIFDDSEVPLSLYLSNFFCMNCTDVESKMIINYTACINDLNDTILYGECSSCKDKVVRYLETGEVKESADIVKSLRKLRSQ